VTNVLNNTVVNLSVNATDFTPTLKTNTAADAITFNIGGTGGGLTISKISPDVRYETITVNSVGTSANTLTEIGTAVGNVAFGGSTGITLSKATAVTGVLDFSKMGVGVTVGGTADNGVGVVSNQSVIGSGYADTVNVDNDATGAATSGISVDLGAGADTLTVAASAIGSSTFTLGAGNDSVSIADVGGTANVFVVGSGIDRISSVDQTNTNQVVIRTSATSDADAFVLTPAAAADLALGAGVGIDFSYKGALANGTGTTSAAASAVNVASSTSVSADLSAALIANANATVFNVAYDLSGDASTALTNLATWVDAATFATRTATFKSALSTLIGTVTGLDSALSSTDKVLITFDNGSHGVIMLVQNTDTAAANTLTAAEMTLVGVINGATAGVVANSFIA
jgi:hypothetical protein